MKALSVLELIALFIALVFMVFGDEIASLRYLVIAVLLKLHQMDYMRGFDSP